MKLTHSKTYKNTPELKQITTKKIKRLTHNKTYKNTPELLAN